ncbi:MAG: amino acid ABC transporter ATP-binding protein [Saprospiraceae bacterium]|jgi:ABC-type polar amino acid transport system ATPase subunit|nr:amino acid ABC transporter ATP-binding protein [Saprospiraceae bacterium]
MISATNISKRINNSIILDDVDIDVNVGQISVLIGPSGSGKTSLLKLLSLIENPTSGTIIIDNDEFQFPSVNRKIREQFTFTGSQTVGVVLQNLDLIPHWTCRENILKPLGTYVLNKDNELLAHLSEIFKMDHFLGKYPHHCSRGEQQRVAFVRAVMLKPKYLFLDEITSALDPELVAELFKFLINLRNNGTGIFIVTHFLLFAQNVADHIVFLKQGKIFEFGKKEIMLDPQTKELEDFLNSIKGIIIK